MIILKRRCFLHALYMFVFGLRLRMLLKRHGAAVGIGKDIKKDVLRPCLGAAVGIGIWMCCRRASMPSLHPLVPPCGLVNDIKEDDPPGPPCTLRCRRGDWYMILKGSAAAMPRCRRGDSYMILKRMCLQTLPAPSCAAVGIGI